MSEDARNVLLLTFARRHEELGVRTALISLYARYPSAHVFAVGTPATEPVLHDLGVEQVLVYNADHSARRVVEEAKLSMPEVAGIVYDDPRYRGHLKLEALALLVGSRTVLRCVLGLDPVPIGRARLAFVVLGKSIHMLARAVAGTAISAVACVALCWVGRAKGARGASGA